MKAILAWYAVVIVVIGLLVYAEQIEPTTDALSAEKASGVPNSQVTDSVGNEPINAFVGPDGRCG